MPVGSVNLVASNLTALTSCTTFYFALELNLLRPEKGGKRSPFEFIPVICTKHLAVEPVARIHHPHCLPNGRKVLLGFFFFFCMFLWTAGLNKLMVQ